FLSGQWTDSDVDRRFRRPTNQELYDEIDRFHPPGADSTWGEWHYFNIAPAADEWWYVTYLIGGKLREGKGGGQLLVTRQRDGHPARRALSPRGQGGGLNRGGELRPGRDPGAERVFPAGRGSARRFRLGLRRAGPARGCGGNALRGRAVPPGRERRRLSRP